MGRVVSARVTTYRTPLVLRCAVVTQIHFHVVATESEVPVPPRAREEIGPTRVPQVERVVGNILDVWVGDVQHAPFVKEMFCVHSFQKRVKMLHHYNPSKKAWSHTNHGNSTPTTNNGFDR